MPDPQSSSDVPLSTTIYQLQRLKEGDQAALDGLFARYRPRVCTALALSLGKLPAEIADIEDIVQETFISAWKRIRRFEHRTDGSFMGWLVTIALNKARDKNRAQLRKKHGGGRVKFLRDVFDSSSLNLPVAGREARPSQVAQAAELKEAEMRAILQLERKYRDVIVDREVLGLSYQEIADKLGYKTENPPRALYSRAKAKLRELLQGFDGGATQVSGDSEGR